MIRWHLFYIAIIILLLACYWIDMKDASKQIYNLQFYHSRNKVVIFDALDKMDEQIDYFVNTFNGMKNTTEEVYND